MGAGYRDQNQGLETTPSTQDPADLEPGLPDFIVSDLQQSLLAWYGEQGRQLPWRNIDNSYAIWISEIMLAANPGKKTVLPYYTRWRAAISHRV